MRHEILSIKIENVELVAKTWSMKIQVLDESLEKSSKEKVCRI